jgi:hypothetical protein
MPMEITLLFPDESRTETVEDVVFFDVGHADENRVIIDQTDGRGCEYTAPGLTVIGGAETE